MKQKVSKGEILCRKFFKYYFGKKCFYNYRPNWLKNPKTGHNLEIDIYYPKEKLAIEFQGIHHCLKYQKEKDKIKEQVCKKRKVKLIKIFEPHQLFRLRKKLCLDRLSPCLKKEIAKYRRSHKGKIGKYVAITKWKIKKEKSQKIQQDEIEFNKKMRLQRKEVLERNELAWIKR